VCDEISYYLCYRSIQQLFYLARAPEHCVMHPHSAGNQHFSFKQTILCPAAAPAILLRGPASSRILGAAALSPSVFPEIQIFWGSAHALGQFPPSPIPISPCHSNSSDSGNQLWSDPSPELS